MRKHRPAFKAFLGAIVAVSLLGLAEVSARLAGIAPAYRPDATGRWQVRANLVDHKMVGSREPHDFSITTNADGLRTPHALTAPEGVFRVALMGDSTVFGWGVSDHESIAAVAEEALHQSGLTHIEVMNAGQPGYSTGMAGWLFDRSIASYKPSLTIVFVSMHDFNQTLVSDVERHLGPQSIRAHIRTFLVRHVALYEWARRKLYPLAHEPQLLPNVVSKEIRVPRVSEEERTRVLQNMTEEAERWNGAIAIGFLPFHRDLMGNTPHASDDRPGVQHAYAWSKDQNQDVFDLRDCCGPGANERTFAFDRGHLNALGNREVGVALANQIKAYLIPQQ
jgi:lysophospholipase L1-like esterase